MTFVGCVETIHDFMASFHQYALANCNSLRAWLVIVKPQGLKNEGTFHLHNIYSNVLSIKIKNHLHSEMNLVSKGIFVW